MPTLRQKRLVEALPTSKTLTEALIKADYTPSVADKHAGEIMSSKGVKELMADLGINTQDLMREYKWIADQRKDLSNKRIVTENLLEANGIKIKSVGESEGNTLNYLQININSGEEVKNKLLELQKELQNLETL